MMGYPLIYTVILGGPYVSIALAATAFRGAFLFLDYLKENSRIWRMGLLFPASHYDNNHGNPLPCHHRIIPDGHG